MTEGSPAASIKASNRTTTYGIRPGNDLSRRFQLIVETLARLRARAPASSMVKLSPAMSLRRCYNCKFVPGHDYPLCCCSAATNARRAAAAPAQSPWSWSSLGFMAST
jgi:hypothetical protein